MFTCQKKTNLTYRPMKKVPCFRKQDIFFCGPIFKIQVRTVYQNISTFNLINITIKNIAINTGRLWLSIRPIKNCTVAILDVQGDTAISLCRECSLVCQLALAFRRGVLGSALTLLNAPLVKSCTYQLGDNTVRHLFKSVQNPDILINDTTFHMDTLLIERKSYLK